MNISVDRELLKRLIPVEASNGWTVWNTAHVYQAAIELRAVIEDADANVHRKDDQNFNAKQLMARAAKVLLLDPDNTSWFEIVGELEKKLGGL